MGNDLTERLLTLKDKAAEAKTKKDRAEGEQKGLIKTLQEKYKLRTVPAAEKALKEQEKEITVLDKELEKGVAELEEKYGWN